MGKNPSQFVNTVFQYTPIQPIRSRCLIRLSTKQTTCNLIFSRVIFSYKRISEQTLLDSDIPSLVSNLLKNTFKSSAKEALYERGGSVFFPCLPIITFRPSHACYALPLKNKFILIFKFSTFNPLPHAFPVKAYFKIFS